MSGNVVWKQVTIDGIIYIDRLAYEEAAEDLARYQTLYEERGMAMRESREMVRSIYLPKLKRAIQFIRKYYPVFGWAHISPEEADQIKAEAKEFLNHDPLTEPPINY